MQVKTALAASAWRRFTKASDRQRINPVIDRARPAPWVGLLLEYSTQGVV